MIVNPERTVVITLPSKHNVVRNTYVINGKIYIVTPIVKADDTVEVMMTTE